MNHPINTALCSFGMSGKVFHAPYISTNPNFKLIGAWERSKKTIQQFYPNAISFSSYEEILNDKNIQLIIVNTPTYTHFDYAQKALQAGKHIVVEKAFTTTVSEAQELIALATAKGLQIAVYQNRRWDSDFLTVKKTIESNALGYIKEAELRFDRFNANLSHKIHKEEPNPGAGIVKDLGPHIIDQALFLFGMPHAVFADIDITRPTSVVDDYFEILLYYTDKRVRLKASYFVKNATHSYKVHGTNGTFIKSRADVQETKLNNNEMPTNTAFGEEPIAEQGTLMVDKNGTTITEKIITEVGNYALFYKGVAHALVNNTTMPVTATDGLRVMKIIEAAFQSSKEQRVISTA
jgi:scyllo-inositol 2-dehydrogenase (NADP+)